MCLLEFCTRQIWWLQDVLQNDESEDVPARPYDDEDELGDENDEEHDDDASDEESEFPTGPAMVVDMTPSEEEDDDDDRDEGDDEDGADDDESDNDDGSFRPPCFEDLPPPELGRDEPVPPEFIQFFSSRTSNRRSFRNWRRSSGMEVFVLSTGVVRKPS